jgi:DNA-binding protein H-NS
MEDASLVDRLLAQQKEIRSLDDHYQQITLRLEEEVLRLERQVAHARQSPSSGVIAEPAPSAIPF